MLNKIKNLFQRRPAHEKLYIQMLQYAKARGIRATNPAGHLYKPYVVGKRVGQQILNDYKMGVQ